MILRKPYKFLIKHFKLIHLLMLLPILYLIIKTNGIYNAFSSYVKNNYSSVGMTNLAGSHINFFMYFAIIIIIGISLIIYYLMRQKKKNTKLYIAMMVYYLILFIAITVYYNALSNMELTSLSVKASRAYRDISLIVNLPEYFFAFYAIFRGLGFDIKSFRFELDLKDLDISEEDNEEFEFVVGIETYKYKRTIRRFIREFKYYVLENKFIFTIISGVVGVIILTGIYLHFNVYNKVYTQSNNFAHNAFNITLQESMITNMDYNGQVITKGKYYLVLKLDVTNNSLLAMKLDIDNFRLQLKGKDYLVPQPDRTDYFIDFATPYHGEKIKKTSTTTYNLVYELNESQVKSNYKIKILESVDYKIGDIRAKYKILSIKPKQYFAKDEAKKYNLKDKIDLTGSLLESSTTKINSYEISDTYIYEYTFCESKNTCRKLNDVVSVGYTTNKTPTTLLILDADTKLDKNIPYTKAIKSNTKFYDDFITVKSNGVEYLTKDATPLNLKDKVVLIAPANIKEATNLDLVITIRNRVYEVKLK